MDERRTYAVWGISSDSWRCIDTRHTAKMLPGAKFVERVPVGSSMGYNYEALLEVIGSFVSADPILVDGNNAMLRVKQRVGRPQGDPQGCISFILLHADLASHGRNEFCNCARSDVRG